MGLAVDLDPPRVGIEPPSGSRRGVGDDDVVDADEATRLTRLEKFVVGPADSGFGQEDCLARTPCLAQGLELAAPGGPLEGMFGPGAHESNASAARDFEPAKSRDDGALHLVARHEE